MSPLLFTFCFMFLVVLLALGVIYSRVIWTIKAILIVASLLFSALFYRAYVDSFGYPASVAPPELFRFLYGVVQDPQANDPGAIYIWIMTDGPMPRALVLPFSPETRKTLAEAKRKVKEGQMVYMGTRQQSRMGRPGTETASRGKSDKSYGDGTVPYNVEGDNDLEFKPAPDNLPRKSQ